MKRRRSKTSRKLTLQDFIDRMPKPDPFCICDFMLEATGETYICERATFERCENRRKRGASNSAPSTVPPLSNRGVSSSRLTPHQTHGKSLD